MVYQGSKDRLAKYILPIIHQYIEDNNIDTYIELFVGGANMIDKVHCKNKLGSDYNEYLITLLKYLQSDTELSIAPSNCTFEHYKEVREAYNNRDYSKFSKEYIALIGYMASYGGRFFDGGYGKDTKGIRNIYAERLENIRQQAPLLNNIEFKFQSYDSININDYTNCLFYLDPPYRDTKQYAKQSIDYDEFYDFCRQLGQNNIVLISEYYMPEDFECVWQKDVKVMQKSDRVSADVAVEKLFVYSGNHKQSTNSYEQTTLF